jgi:hypothetical protein
MHELVQVLLFVGIVALVFGLKQAIHQYGVRKRCAGTETFWTRNLLEKWNNRK